MIWFTSDEHFWHKNVIRFCDRPFCSKPENHIHNVPCDYCDVQAMNEDLIRKWNEVVKPDDTVYCLGDFSMAIRPVEAYTPRLLGHKILISGNHDWTHPSNKKSKTPEKAANVRGMYYGFGWKEIHNSLTIEIGGKIVNMCHLPYQGDNTDDRFHKHRLVDDGRVLLCGHVHEKWKTKLTPKGTLMINVGVDVWDGFPISIDEIKKTMEAPYEI